MPGYPMDMRGWASRAHPQMWILPHLRPDPSPWSAPEFGFILRTPTLESTRGKNPVIQKVGDGWGTMRKSFRILQHWCYREKEDKRADKHGQGRRQLPPASPIRFPQSCLCFPPGYRGFFEGRQRALRGQREKRGVSEESEHSCEKCHSYLGNWKYFPSLPEWSFPDFNYFPIVSEKDTWLLTSFGPEEIRLSTF